MLIQSIINGLAMGSVYALISMGLTIIFGVMKLINFAQGECLMLGMYATWVLQRATGLTPYQLIIPVLIVMFIIGQLVYFLFIDPLIGRPGTDFMVVTMGVAMVMVSIVQLLFSPTYQSVISDIRDVAVKIGSDFAVGLPRVIAAGVLVLVVIVIQLLLQKTDFGRAMRATAENKEVAQMLGINTLKTFSLSFTLGVMLAGLCGLLLSPIYYTFPNVGMPFKTIAMVIVVLGGLGSIEGAVICGMLAGIAEAMLGAYFSPDIAPAGIYALLILVLFFKPHGLFGKVARKA